MSGSSKCYFRVYMIVCCESVLEPSTISNVVGIESTLLLHRDPLIPEAIIIIVVIDRDVMLIVKGILRLHIINISVWL